MNHPLVPVFWPTQHEHHAPEAEYDNGLLVAYADVPARVDHVKTALAALPFVRLEACAEGCSPAELAQVHAPELLNYVQETSEKARGNGQAYVYPSVFPGYFAHSPGMNAKKLMGGMYAFDVHAPIGGGTETAVLHSAASALKAAQTILDGKARLVYALCRPPGHHAGRRFTGGYCYLNNAALAANRLKALGKGAILDIDYHHGNGTQDIVWDDPGVFFASLHADPAYEYPYYTGYADETGGPHAPGTIANYPLPQGTDDRLYLDTLQTALSAIASFKPNWLVVSLGFDTFSGDLLSTFTLTLNAYVEMGRLIAELNLPTVLAQEGGYNVAMLGTLAQTFLAGMTGIHKSGEL